MTYKGTKDWIVFGKDESGNVLLASKEPVGKFYPTWNAQHWISWEDDLDLECAGYGSTLQGKTIQARSITIEDINRAVGFTEPTFTTYKFTTDAEGSGQFANGKVNYYYPRGQNFTKATVTTLTATAPDIPAKEFDFNKYSYYYDTSSSKYILNWASNGSYRTDEIDLTTNLLKVDNMKYAVGETGSYMSYYVASRSVSIESRGAYWYFVEVFGGKVSVGSNMVYTDSSHVSYPRRRTTAA